MRSNKHKHLVLKFRGKPSNYFLLLWSTGVCHDIKSEYTFFRGNCQIEVFQMMLGPVYSFSWSLYELFAIMKFCLEWRRQKLLMFCKLKENKEILWKQNNFLIATNIAVQVLKWTKLWNTHIFEVCVECACLLGVVE